MAKKVRKISKSPQDQVGWKDRIRKISYSHSAKVQFQKFNTIEVGPITIELELHPEDNKDEMYENLKAHVHQEVDDLVLQRAEEMQEIKDQIK